MSEKFFDKEMDSFTIGINKILNEDIDISKESHTGKAALLRRLYRSPNTV